MLLRTFVPAVVIVAILLAALVYNRLYASIIDGFERKLVTTAALTAAMIDPADHDLLIRAVRDGEILQRVEASDAYERNAAPIRRVRETLGLTYLYTQVLGGPSDIFYVLDATQGEEHSALGSADDLTEETRAGLRQLEARGTIYISPIEYQEQWGLLKTAAAPILGREGRITGSAGADVNISVIQIATQNALFMSAMIGVGSILLCLLVSKLLMRRISDPIEALTHDMMQIAGGRGRSITAVPRPREVKRLAETLNGLVEKTKADARCRDEEYHAREVSARIRHLTLETNAAKEPVALITQYARQVFWIAYPRCDAETVLAHRAMIHHARCFADDSHLASQWRQLADIDHGWCLAVDGKAGRAELFGTGTLEISIGGRMVVLEPGTSLAFDPAEAVSIVGAEGRSYDVWPGAGQ